jgi:AraC-like DNA-binding protein
MRLFQGKPKRLQIPIKSPVLFRLTLSLLLPSVLFFLVVSMLLPSLYNAAMQKDINAMAQMTLASIGSAVENLEDRARTNAYQTFKFKEVRPLLFNQNVSNEEIVAAAYTLSNVISMNPDIDSIQLVRDGQVILSQGGVGQLDDAYKDVKTFLKGPRPMLTLTPRVVENKNKKVYLLSTIYANIVPVQGRETCIIVNYKADALMNDINRKSLDNGQSFLICTKNGQVLFSNGTYTFGEDATMAPFFLSARASKGDIDSFPMEVNEILNVVHFHATANERYYLFYLSRTEELYKKMLSLRRLIIVICLVLFIGMLVAISWITKIIYRPIGNLYANIRRTLGEEGRKNAISSESQALSSLFRKTVERLDNLERLQDSFLAERKNHFMQSILHHGRIIEEPAFRDKLAEFGISTTAVHAYRFVLLRMDHFHSLVDKHAPETLRFQADTVESLMLELLPPDLSCLVFQTEPDALLALLTTQTAVAAEDVIASLQAISRSASQLLGLCMTCCVGDECDSLSSDSIRTSWKMLLHTSERRFHEGTGHIFRQGEKSGLSIPDGRKAQDFVFRLGKHARAGEQSAYATTLTELLAALVGIDYETRSDWLVKAAIEVVSAIRGLPQGQEMNERWSVAVIIRQVQSLETKEEATEWFLRLFEGAGEALEMARGKSPLDFGDLALQLVHAHYRDPNLSASSLAERMGISAQYFSRTFHQKTGISFPDHVSMLRLEKAHALLTDGTKRSIQQICALTGFTNASYFGAAFRKRYGVPPSKLALLARQADSTTPVDDATNE